VTFTTAIKKYLTTINQSQGASAVAEAMAGQAEKDFFHLPGDTGK
jgi:hypothetical protein